MQLNPAKMARPVHADGRRYVPAIDGLRCLAAFGVISAHIGSEFGPTQNLVAYYGAAAYPSLIVFFTISGFLVYRPFARSALSPREASPSDRSTNFWVYILRRVLRIFPLYWAVLAVSQLLRPHAVFGVRLGGGGNLHGLTDWVQAVFLLPFPHPTHLLNGPLGIAMWTLAIELPFYVVVPLYAAGVKALHRRIPELSAFQFQLVVISVVLATIFGLGLVYGGELAFPILSIPTGMLFAILETHQHLARRRYRLIKVLADNWWLCVGAYVALVFVGAHLALDAYNRPGVTDPYDAIRNAYFPIQMTQALLLFIPVAFGSRRLLSVRLMSSAPLQILAPLTYGIYLWHVPLLHYSERWFGRGFLGFPVPGTTGFGMPTVTIAIGLAICTFVLVELPAARLRTNVDRWSRGLNQPRTTPARRRTPTTPAIVPRVGPDPSPPDGDGDRRGGPSKLVGATARSSDPTGSGDRGSSDGPGPSASRRSDPPPPPPPPRRSPGRGTPPALRGASPDPSSAQGRPVDAGTTALATPWCQPVDGFRAICACLAVAGHTFLSSAIIPFSGTLHVLGILVALFFSISAYVLYQPFLEADVRRVERPEAATFYLRRLLRIYPLFALALTLYLVILPALRPDTLWGYARLFLFLQIFGRELSGLKGLPSAWYLCNEVIFYLCMPVMAFAAARWSNRHQVRSPARRLKAHLAIGWGMVVVGPFTRTMLYVFKVPAPTSLPLSHLEFFGFGVVLAAYSVGTRIGIEPPSLFRWLRSHTTAAYALVLVPVAVLAGIGARWGNGTGSWTDGNFEDRLRFFPYLIAIVLLMTAATLGAPSDRSNRWLSSSFFKPLSGLALHIYLWHQLVLGIMNKMFDGIDKVSLGPRFLTGAVLVTCAIGGSFLLARLSQPLTDWPYEKYRAINGRLRGRAAAPQPRRQRPRHPAVLEPHPS